MPYISSSGVPSPIGPDAYAPTTNMKSIVDGEAVYDYFITVAADSDRTSLATPTLREGLHCFVLATHLLWRYDTGAWQRLSEYTDSGRQATNQVSSTGTNDLDAGVSFAALPFDTVISLSGSVVFDLTGSPPSARTMSIAFVTTAGTLTNDNATPLGFAASISSSTAIPTFQSGTLALPASTTATVKLQSTISASSPRANASAWYWVRRPA